jgi:hypothetical protein
MTNKQIMCLLVAAVFSLSTPVATMAQCKIRELVAAENGSCPTCLQGCSGGVYTIPQYYRCADAGTGQAGKCVCNGHSSPIATYYPCELDFNTTHYLACLAGAAACGALCGACLVPPVSAVACASCIACVAALVRGCEWCDYNTCVKGTAQTGCYRYVFDSLSGADCQG